MQPIQTLSVSMAGSFHGLTRFFGRFRRRWEDMEHRPEEPLGESSGDEQDWSDGTCGTGCALPMLAEWFPMTRRMTMRHIMAMGVKKAMQSPIPISHPAAVLLRKFLNFCWAWRAHCVSRS